MNLYTIKNRFSIILILLCLSFKNYSQCTSNSSLYPAATFTPNCNGTSQNITTAGYATEYSMVYVTSGTTYTFSSSISTDYLTIANSAGGAPVYAFGTTPVIWTATITGPVRFYNNTNSSCGTNTSTRTRSIICGTPPAAPANNNCSGSFTATVNSSTTCATTSTATSSGATQSQASCAGTADDDVWFTFTATSTSHSITVTPGTMSDVVLQGFSGTCGSLTSLGCVDNTSGTSAEVASLTGLTIGTVYYFRVHSFGSGGAGVGTFTVCITTPPAPPANDNCSGAFTVAVNSSTTCTTTQTATSTNATQSQTSCGGTADDDVWFSFTATSTTHSITITPGTMSDVVLQGFSGACGGLTSLGCVDNTGGTSAEVASLTGLTIGTVYYFRVHSYSSGGTGAGTFTVCVTTGVPAADPCTTPTNIASCGTSISTTIASGTGVYGSSACGFTTGGNEKIYTFTPSSTGSYSISQGSSFAYIDYQFKLFSAGCSSSGWTCIDDISGAGTSPGVTLTAGVQYYLLLDPESTAGGTVTFTILCPPTPPSNDEPTGATPITPAAACSYTTFTNVGSSTSTCGTIPAPGCASFSGEDVWFSVVVPATGAFIIDSQTGSMTDGGMAVYAGTACGAMTLINCDDDGSANGAMPTIAVSGQTPGSTMYIRFWEYAGGSGTFGLCVTTYTPPAAPANDNCPGAYSVTVNSGTTCSSLTNGTLLGATTSTQTNSCASGNDDDDVWYSFVATSTSHSVSITNVAGTPTDLYHSVFAGTCGSIGSPITCSDPNTSSVFGLTIGNTYYIRVYSYGSSAGATSTFSVCVTTPPPTGPCGNQTTNDFCSNPATLTQGAGTFSSTTSSIYSADQSSPLSGIFCGSIENNSWYKFVATATTASFPFTSISGCTWGDGVQAQVYSVTTNTNGCCTAFSSVSNCYNPGTTSTGTVNATGLTIGQTYILMVDGWGGDVCNFTVSNWTAVGILPLNLLTFVGENAGSYNKIEWVTGSERNTDHFILEKSRNGIAFEELLNQTAAGFSTSPKNYKAFDMSPFEGVTYYRLKLFNQNASFEYSNIIAINNDNLTDYVTNLHPNPTTSNIEFDVNTTSKNNISVDLINNTGAIVSTQLFLLNEGYNNIKLNMEKFDAGIYLAKISFENSGKIVVEKIIKR